MTCPNQVAEHCPDCGAPHVKKVGLHHGCDGVYECGTGNMPNDEQPNEWIYTVGDACRERQDTITSNAMCRLILQLHTECCQNSCPTDLGLSFVCPAERDAGCAAGNADGMSMRLCWSAWARQEGRKMLLDPAYNDKIWKEFARA